MIVSIDLCLIPLGTSISFSPYIAACKAVIEKTGLDYDLGPNGTAIEGEWDEVFACVKECHEKVHSLGSVRIYSTIKVNTRTDRVQSFREKVPNVLSSHGKENP
tara:strand:- start:200 stop:511 length:312 start_codon:yes stop_codon:yes gene_type:complete